MYAGEQLLDVEWLCDIVVRAHIESVYLICGLSLRGEHNDRHRGLLPDVPAYLPAVLDRQHDIEQHYIRGEKIEAGLCLPAVGDHDVKPVLTQIQSQQLCNVRIVFNNKSSFTHSLFCPSLS